MLARAHGRAGSDAADVLGDQAGRAAALPSSRARRGDRARAARDPDRSARAARASTPPRVRDRDRVQQGHLRRAAWSRTSAPTLGCGAHLTELRRTRSGVFSIAQAYELDRHRGRPARRDGRGDDACRASRSPRSACRQVRSGCAFRPEMLGIDEPEARAIPDSLRPDGRLARRRPRRGDKVVYDRVFVLTGLDGEGPFTPISAPTTALVHVGRGRLATEYAMSVSTAQARDHRQVPAARDRHRFARSPGRAALRARLAPHRAPEEQPQGSPQPPWSAARWSASAARCSTT